MYASNFQVHRSEDPAVWALLPLVTRGWPSLSGQLATLPTTPYCLSRSTSIIYGYSPPGQPPKQNLWGLENLFLRCEDQGIRVRQA